jgi:integrase
MASIHLDRKSGYYYIRFRHGEMSFKRSLKTRDRREANAIRGRVTETILLVERGRLEIPSNADPGIFLLSDGKRNGKPEKPKVRTLRDLFRVYNDELPEGAKEKTTLIGERRHPRFFKKHLGATTVAQSLTVADVQAYVEKRSHYKWGGDRISPETISKELATLRLMWNWAVDRGYLKGGSPTKGVRLPKRSEKPPFMTRDGILQKIERGGLSEKQVAELWHSLFLTREETSELLKYVRESARHPFIYPMFVFVAHTGARRSEILRSRVDDFNLSTSVVAIREKKKDHKRRITLRHVDMTPLLSKTMKEWFASHPGGQFTIWDDPNNVPEGRQDDEMGYCPYRAHHHFKTTLAGSKWEKVRGFHVFRHSFASNLAAVSVDQRIIDEWLGHQTDEMRRRYRHLFPKQRRSAIESVFGGDGE